VWFLLHEIALKRKSGKPNTFYEPISYHLQRTSMRLKAEQSVVLSCSLCWRTHWRVEAM